MRMVDLILKKRQGRELSSEEIYYFIQGFSLGEIPDYQASALLMAIYFNKMSKRETVDLTKAMTCSGDILDLTGVHGMVVDKHSTGGVGDTTTLILAPLIASCGIPMAKMSGRGLGHTGGTIDKLEAIPGFNTEMTKEMFIRKVNDTGIAIAGQTGELAPADKKLYALRDVTGTVDSLPLIASSIMSKKLASGAQGILLDVKTGDGAFMKSLEDSLNLAEAMLNIGSSLGRNVSAIITDMNQPLGRAVGNALEVREAIHILKGKGSDDLYHLCLTLGVELLIMAGITDAPQEAMDILQKNIDEGNALDKFRQLIISQGGDPMVLENTALLPAAEYILKLKGEKEGYIRSIKAQEVGACALILGAGRETKDSDIDLSVGIYLDKKVGEKVKRGDTIATIYTNDLDKGNEALQKLKMCYTLSSTPVAKGKLIYGILNKQGTKIF
ncbi:MAG: pyrimidine-nucleoside phosphorylase [Eubacteriales bacterium]